jgi:galactose mutarotase-like enzyme
MSGALCLEQVWPDFVNKPSFPQSILSPGQLYRHIWSLKFYNHTAAPAPGVQTASIP